MDFFRDAPVGGIVLVAAGLLLWLVEIPLRLRLKSQVERNQAGGPISEPPSRLPLLLTPLSWGLILAGLGWYVFGAE